MTIETELKLLVQLYAKFDEKNNRYVSQLDKLALLRLDADLSKLINQQLLTDGLEKGLILKNYKKMSRYFHPDRKNLFLSEVIWLEKNLSQGLNDGACFKNLFRCYEKLTTPQRFKELSFSDIKSREDCRKWLENLKSKSGTYTERSFFDSLIDLLNQSGGFFDEVGQIKPTGLRTLITFMPMIFATYGAAIFSEELFAVYALYFFMLKGGQYLGRSDFIEMKQLGKTLQDISVISATATTTLLVRLLEMTFWVSHQCYDVSLQIGSSILRPLLPTAPKVNSSIDPNRGPNLCKELILASHNISDGIRFKTPELKIISAPFESYLSLNAQQFFGNWRLGKTKRLMVEAFLFRMRVLDDESDTIEVKLIAAQKELKKLKKNKEVYTKGGKTAEAVDNAEQVITLLIEPASSSIEPDRSSMQLVLYKKQ